MEAVPLHVQEMPDWEAREDEQDWERRGQRRPFADLDEDEYEERRRRRPHRGAVVLTLGILGLVFSCIPILGWVLGGMAMSMAGSDLREMSLRRMDRSGRGLTQAGRICGTIGVVLAFGFCGLGCLMQLGRRH
jgi:hypothetical protein